MTVPGSHRSVQTAVTNRRKGSMAKDTVKLISAEGFEFIVDYQAACVSNTIKNMLSSSGTGSVAGAGVAH